MILEGEIYLQSRLSHPNVAPNRKCTCCQPSLLGQRVSSRRQAQFRARAENKAREEATKESTTGREAEAERIADLERRSRKNRKIVAKQEAPAPSSSSSGGGEGFAEWKEGELFPKGFENMNPVQKAGELWAGKRGALFWANKAAWASVFVIGGAWVLFRIVGPLTGLYTLKNDLLSPPNQ